MPSSIAPVVSTEIPRVEESSSSVDDEEEERLFNYESSEQESNSDVVTEDEAESIINDDSPMRNNSHHRQKNDLKRNFKRRAYSPNENHEVSKDYESNNPHELPSVADDDAVDMDVLEKLRKISKGAAKRVVKNPRPKLDPQRLLSNKGLPALLEDFKKVKFRGKGYEFQDLNRLLFVYEAWSNRLVPRMSFDEVIDRLENVGSKREIRVALHRLRNGIWPPYASEEQIVPSDNESTSEQEDPELMWKKALESVPKDDTLNSTKSPSKNIHEDFRQEWNHINNTENLADSVNIQSSPLPQASTSVDIESRAERNKRLALERLAARKNSSSGTLKMSTSHILKNALKASVINTPLSNNAGITKLFQNSLVMNEKLDTCVSGDTLYSENVDTPFSNNNNNNNNNNNVTTTALTLTLDNHETSTLWEEETPASPDKSQSILHGDMSPVHVDESNLIIDLN
ncbi:unnamed protein product [Schistosoma turkestanicum]|nr:unnamed protein product [Schistosoma turkestanicum]